MLSRQALVESFRSEGHHVRLTKRDKHDRPDILLEVSGIRVACECVQIPPAYIYRDHQKQPDESDWGGCDLLSMLWPNEPHEWISDAIEKKTRLVPDYLERTDATEPWLLVHSPPENTQSFLRDHQQWVIWALRYGSKTVEHPFTQIHLWTPQGGIHPIFVRDQHADINRELDIDFSHGYPTLCVNRASFNFTTPEASNTSPNKFAFEHGSKNQVVIEPRNPEYRKYPPARRDFKYRFQVTAWPNRAVVETEIKFVDEGQTRSLDPNEINELAPGQEFWFYYLHEFRAPRNWSTSYQTKDS